MSSENLILQRLAQILAEQSAARERDQEIIALLARIESIAATTSEAHSKRRRPFVLRELPLDENGLVPNEQAALAAFALAHQNCGATPQVHKASGGGIGARHLARCPACEAEQDLTDYSCW